MDEKVIGRALEDAEEGELLEVELGAGDGGEALFRRLRPAEETADFLVRVTGKESLIVHDVARIVHEERGVFFLRSAEPGSAVDPIEVESAGFVPWDGLIGYTRLSDEVDEDEEAAEDRAGQDDSTSFERSMPAPEADVPVDALVTAVDTHPGGSLTERDVEPWSGDVENRFGVGASGGRRVSLALPPGPHSTLSGIEAMVLGAWLAVIGETVADPSLYPPFEAVLAAVRES